MNVLRYPESSANPDAATRSDGTCFTMATSAKKMLGASDDFSSSDEEELKRCREAVWETRSGKNTGDAHVCSEPTVYWTET